MKKLKPILIMTLVSAFAVLTVINMSLASPKSGGENTLDMLEIMTRAFDESEGGENILCPYASWEEMQPDMTSNLCLGGVWLCKLVWTWMDIPVAEYTYEGWTANQGYYTLACGEAIITPQ